MALSIPNEPGTKQMRVGRGAPRPDVKVNAAYLVGLRDRGVLTERDEMACRLLAECGVMSTDQLGRALWLRGGSSGTRSRLRRLYDLHIFDRLQVDFGAMREAGLAPGIGHTLGKGGRLWLKLAGYCDLTRAQTASLTAPQFAIHDLWVSEVMVLFLESARARDDGRFTVEWGGEASARVVVPAKKGSRVKSRVLVEPDGLVCLGYPDGRVQYFVEWDAGTERGQGFEAKLIRYDRYAADEDAWKKRYPAFPRALLFAATRRRADELVKRLTDRRRQTTWLVGDVETLRASDDPRGIVGAMWRVVHEGRLLDGKKPLLPV